MVRGCREGAGKVVPDGGSVQSLKYSRFSSKRRGGGHDAGVRAWCALSAGRVASAMASCSAGFRARDGTDAGGVAGMGRGGGGDDMMAERGWAAIGDGAGAGGASGSGGSGDGARASVTIGDGPALGGALDNDALDGERGGMGERNSNSPKSCVSCKSWSISSYATGGMSSKWDIVMCGKAATGVGIAC